MCSDKYAHLLVVFYFSPELKLVEKRWRLYVLLRYFASHGYFLGTINLINTLEIPANLNG